MSLREKTLNGAKWSAIATVIIIGLGLIQMTVLARIIDNHQFGLLTVSLVIIALADTLSDFGIANSIIQRKEIGYLELTTLYWLNVGLGIVVCVAMFLLSETIAHVLNNPELAPLIKTLSLAFVVIPHGQQFRALMQKELAFNKIGMIETSSVLAGFTFTVVSAHFWPLALMAILGYLVNSTLRTLLFGYFGRRIYRPGLHFSLASVSSNLRFGAWLTADSIINYINTNLSTLVLARTLGAGVAGGFNLAWNVAVVPADKTEPDYHPRAVSGVCQNPGRQRKTTGEFLQAAVSGWDYQLPGTTGTDGGVGQRGAAGVWREVERHYSGPAIVVHCGFAALGGESNRIALDGESPGRYQLQIQCVQNLSVYSCHFHWRSSGGGDWRGAGLSVGPGD